MSLQIPVIAVLGSWSSGSTALTGYLARCGAHSCPPHQTTNDPRTPDSHEPKALRDALADRVDEFSLKWKGRTGPAFRDWFSEWLSVETHRCPPRGTAIVIKHPLLAYFINDVEAICSPKWLIVTRPLKLIEQTRQRRGWHAVYGEAGARVIYSRIHSALMNCSLSASCIAFDDFLKSRATRTHLLKTLNLTPTVRSEALAENWLRPQS